jgi:hypothetical protein
MEDRAVKGKAAEADAVPAEAGRSQRKGRSRRKHARKASFQPRTGSWVGSSAHGGIDFQL